MSPQSDPRRQNVLSYLDDYVRRGSETMLVGACGLRRARWSYERVVLRARRLARELEEVLKLLQVNIRSKPEIDRHLSIG